MTAEQADDIAEMLREHNGLDVDCSDVFANAEQYTFMCDDAGSVIACVRFSPGICGGTWVRHLCVHPDFRGQGLATELVSNLPDSPFYLAVVKQGNRESAAVFSKCGFRQATSGKKGLWVR